MLGARHLDRLELQRRDALCGAGQSQEVSAAHAGVECLQALRTQSHTRWLKRSHGLAAAMALRRRPMGRQSFPHTLQYGKQHGFQKARHMLEATEETH